MERLTSHKSKCKREMVCRYEDCDTCEEYGPHLNEDNCSCLQEVIDKLAEYEDLEEQGKLLKLPCAVRDTVYRINKGAKEPIISMTVVEVGILSLKIGGFAVEITCHDDIYGGETCYLNSDFRRNVFLSREEAEAALE